MTETLLRTPLAATHEALGARMVPFSGWLMPLQYKGLVAEHLHTRSEAGLFDLSHMGRLKIEGSNAGDLVQLATTNDIERLAPGAAHYSLICNDGGGVIEDLLVYRLVAGWRLVVNASNRLRVIALLDDLRKEHEFEATVLDETFELALLGLQGPASEGVLQPFDRWRPWFTGLLSCSRGFAQAAHVPACISRTDRIHRRGRIRAHA